MPKPQISLVHQSSNPFSRNAALALAEVSFLNEVITTIAYNPEGAIAHTLHYLPKKMRDRLTQELGRRTWSPPEGASICPHPGREIARLALTKSGLNRRLGLAYLGSIDWVCTSLDCHVAKYHLQGLDAIYAYEDGAATSFQAAKQQGILCLYDLPILFYRLSRKIQAEEAQRFPELAPALQAAQEPAWKLERKEQEIHLADHTFVASSITKQSLLKIGVNSEKITVIPYGAPVDYFHPQTKQDKLFRALFVGSVSPRKGVHYLLKAWQALKLPEAELLLVGANQFPKSWLTPYQDIIRHIPSVPHSTLNIYYSAANVFVFPSLVEGFGLVLLEAMACGIPVITTPNTAGPDILTDGVEGFIIPIRDIETLQEKLEWCYCHPQELAEMGRAARQKAEQLNWEMYRQKLAHKVQTLLNGK
ncbi:MAG: glycosyl transferase family 1 [Cyanobacteria bacterium QH_8_48_120]|nr:MAG: glycosyl transferase family 1 [Cyanobacteria bacterium QH_8_48_120]